MEVGLTLMDVPELTSVCPQPPVYQSTVWPLPTVADKVDDWPAQIVEGLALPPVGSDGIGLTVRVVDAHEEFPHVLSTRT